MHVAYRHLHLVELIGSVTDLEGQAAGSIDIPQRLGVHSGNLNIAGNLLTGGHVGAVLDLGQLLEGGITLAIVTDGEGSVVVFSNGGQTGSSFLDIHSVGLKVGQINDVFGILEFAILADGHGVGGVTQSNGGAVLLEIVAQVDGGVGHTVITAVTALLDILGCTINGAGNSSFLAQLGDRLAIGKGILEVSLGGLDGFAGQVNGEESVTSSVLKQQFTSSGRICSKGNSLTLCGHLPSTRTIISILVIGYRNIAGGQTVQTSSFQSGLQSIGINLDLCLGGRRAVNGQASADTLTQKTCLCISSGS